MKKNLLKRMVEFWRVCALGAALALGAGWADTAVAQVPSSGGASFGSIVDRAEDAIADGAEAVGDDKGVEFTANLLDELSKAIEKGADDLGKIAEYGDEIGKASKAFKVLDYALKAIKIGDLTYDSAKAWNAQDRQGFIDAFNTEVLEIIKLATGIGGAALGGAAAGAALGSIVPGAGTLAGAIVGALGGVIGGAITEWATEKAYKKYVEAIVKEKAAELYDRYHQEDGPGLPQTPSGDGGGQTPENGNKPKVIPQFTPLQI
jgi:outer membrane lipoprotein SlyB